MNDSSEKKTNDGQTAWIVQRKEKRFCLKIVRSSNHATTIIFIEQTNFPKDFEKPIVLF